MKKTIEQKVSIHNRFDIEVVDIRTGKIRDRYQAENIVLNQMWDRLCARAAYFVNIHYGTGAGTLAASRTSLFTHLGTKTAVNDTQSKALPTSYWRQKIVLNPEDNVGAVLSEVGVAYGATASYLVTHAMIRDMNNNVVTITKTAFDVVTIYATIYCTFSTSNANIAIVGMPNNNPLVNYLIGNTSFPSCYFYTGESPMENEETSPAAIGIALGATSAVTWTADTANKRMSTSILRLAVGDSNGHIREIGFGKSQNEAISRLVLPATGIYSGLVLSGVPVGNGDGSEDEFLLPSKNIDLSSVVVRVDGSVDSNVVLTTPRGVEHRVIPVFGTGLSGSGTMWFSKTAEGKLILLSKTGFYEFIGGRWVYMTSYSYGNYYAHAFAAGRFAVFGASVMYDPMSIVEYVNGVATLLVLDNGAQSGSVYNREMSISDDGTVITKTRTTGSGYNSDLLTFTRNGSVLSARPNPGYASYPSIACLSSDGLRMCVFSGGTPYVAVYDWSGTAWVKQATDPSSPGTPASNLDESIRYSYMTRDGEHIFQFVGTSPYVHIWDLTDGVWVKRSVYPTLSGGRTRVSYDGLVITENLAASPYFAVHEFSGGAWHKLPNHLAYASVENSVNNYPALYIPDTEDVFQIISSNDVNIYRLDSLMTLVSFDTPPANGAVITADYTVNGIHKTAQRVIDLQATIQFGEPT